MKKHTIKDGVTGQAINLMSNDVYRFDFALSFFHDTYSAPVKTILAGYFIYDQIGLSGLIGMAVLLLFMPIQGRSVLRQNVDVSKYRRSKISKNQNFEGPINRRTKISKMKKIVGQRY